MSYEIKNLNTNTLSDSKLKTLVRQNLPVLLQACQKLLSKAKPDQSPCENCKMYESCKEPCELLEPQLTSKHTGSRSQNKNYGDLLEVLSDTETNNPHNDEETSQKSDYSYLKTIDKIRSDEIFMLYKNCSIIFSEAEWRVATMKARDGKTFRAIGQIIGITPSTASDTFQRAKKKMENHYRRQALKNDT